MRDKYHRAAHTTIGEYTLNITVGLFHIAKITTTRRMVPLVKALNTNTRDGHIADQARIGRHLWLLRVTCSWRDDADFVRSL
jgi:hypothetical protein